MILVGLGSNLATERHSTSVQVLEAAVKSLEQKGVEVGAISSWYRSAPIPAADQPWFVNAVARIATGLAPADLLKVLHQVEADYGRMRSRPNDSRTLDLDLLAYDDAVVDEPQGLVLPHPRLAGRAFVLMPLVEIAPGWCHPVTGRSAAEMLAALPAGQQVEKMS